MLIEIFVHSASRIYTPAYI